MSFGPAYSDLLRENVNRNDPDFLGPGSLNADHYVIYKGCRDAGASHEHAAAGIHALQEHYNPKGQNYHERAMEQAVDHTNRMKEKYER